MKPAWRSLAAVLGLSGAALWATAQPTVQQPSAQPPAVQQPPGQLPNAQQPNVQQPATPQPPAMLSRDGDFDEEFAAGRQAYAMGNLTDAATHFDKALGLSNPGQQRASALLYLGVVFSAGGRQSDAETAFRAALAANPACTECRFNIGFLLLKESKDAEGVAALKAVLPQLKGTPREREVERFIADPARARKNFAPEFSVRAANGDPVNLDTLHGKVVLLDFWGAWCAPCRQTVPLLKQLAQAFDPAKVAVISVDEHDSQEVWMEFVQKNAMTWAQVYDEDASLKGAFSVEGFPSSVLLSKDGIILQKFKGWGPGWETVMRQEIEKALQQN